MLDENERRGIITEHPDQMARMKNCLKEVQVDASDADVVLAWATYSDRVMASWLLLPENDRELRQILLAHLPHQPSKRPHLNYRVMEFCNHGGIWREIREVYYSHDRPCAYSSTGAILSWTVEEGDQAALEILDRMRAALAQPILKPEDFSNNA
ncbi:hypothetical protein FAZ95_07800 [Trinickia violacea]|uniref:Uncharacterized protein n=1 Tax=Trinickia violacea TaxID=2571746 RepID=A0A4V1EH55_9BURK|nr:hypothetical protein [Trinickia violacea]QCP49090.1 hypothetical protein FAZ95_07800 [Trinickia violacea]